MYTYIYIYIYVYIYIYIYIAVPPHVPPLRAHKRDKYIYVYIAKIKGTYIYIYIYLAKDAYVQHFHLRSHKLAGQNRLIPRVTTESRTSPPLAIRSSVFSR